jgi:integrase
MARTLKTQDDVFALRSSKAEAVFFDEGRAKDRVVGLALRVREGGSRKWVYFYRWNGAQQKLTIGDASAITLADARNSARGYYKLIADGTNPLEAQRTAKNAAQSHKIQRFETVMEAYLAARIADMRPRSHEETSRYLRDHWKPLHELNIKSVDKGTIARTLNAIEQSRGPIARNRARSALSAFYAWAILEDYADANPVEATRKADETARDRILSDAELAAIWNAAPANDYGRIVKLLMLTGQRREEIGGLMLSEIDRDAHMITLPGDRTKNGRAHDVPLSGMAMNVLGEAQQRHGRPFLFGEGAGGFSGWSKAKTALDDSLKGVEAWRLHDLRRTAATSMANLGVQPHVVEAVLNHVSGHKAGVAGIYNRATYAAEKRAALDVWASHLRTILGRASGANVTRLQPKRA